MLKFHSSWMAVPIIAAAAYATTVFALPAATGASPVKSLPAPLIDEARSETGLQTLILAGGCFWGVQGVFQHVRGVTGAVSGYDGGAPATANYAAVSTGATGHAEAVRITYDPGVITAGQLLRIFFSVVTDPTQRDRQFPDTGTQYRSVVFASTADQLKVARAYIAQLSESAAFAAPIATVVVKDTGFHEAENYHQDYLPLHPDSAYIATFDMPKLDALKTSFPDR